MRLISAVFVFLRAVVLHASAQDHAVSHLSDDLYALTDAIGAIAALAGIIAMRWDWRARLADVR